MKRCIAGILAVAVVSLGLAAGLHAQAKKDQATGLDRLEGYVIGIDKDKSEIKIRQKGTTGQEWTLVYAKGTAFTYVNEPATLDKIKEGVRVIALGKFGTEKTKMTAERIDVRTDK
jgi:hypothetical protein